MGIGCGFLRCHKVKIVSVMIKKNQEQLNITVVTRDGNTESNDAALRVQSSNDDLDRQACLFYSISLFCNGSPWSSFFLCLSSRKILLAHQRLFYCETCGGQGEMKLSMVYIRQDSSKNPEQCPLFIPRSTLFTLMQFLLLQDPITFQH